MNSRPTPFLDSIAYAYAAHADEFAGDLSQVCFIFPNRRAGTFFADRLRRALPSDTTGPGPEITSIAEVVELWSGRVVAPRTDLLLILYDCYCRVMGRMDGIPAVFDAFRAWGDVVLTDFNEVEMYMVDADAIFSNLKSLKQISTDYLTDEQKDLVEEYFGYRPHHTPALNFWTHYNNPVPMGQGSSKRRFIQLWEILGPLYEAFCGALEARGMTFTGLAYRQALENLEQRGTAILPFERVVLAGFNALTTVELAIFRTLAGLRRPATDLPLTDFYWDSTGPALADPQNTAGYFVRRHTKPGRFPSMYADEMTRAECATLPGHIELIASPSAAMQTKIAGRIANELLGRTVTDEKGRSHPVRPERIAIVLPDEGLLLPMLHSLPARAASVNVTMGYPMRLTAAATFVRLLRLMWRHSRKTAEGTMLLADDVMVLLGHPLVRLLLGNDAVRTLHTRIRAARSFTVAAESLIPVSPQANSLFAPLLPEASVRQVAEYMDRVLEGMRHTLEHRTRRGDILLIDNEVDGATLRQYNEAIQRLASAVEQHSISTDARTLLLMLERMLAGERIQLEGRPLQGLQVMGVLETRCLDFDYVIILSMNEQVYPRRLSQRSFIPNNLRAGYGMATASHRESIYAYYFYRMISRAREVYMIYDSQSEGVKSGDVSRYALQLQHLYARGKVQLRTGQFRLEAPDRYPITVTKTAPIMRSVREYFTPGSGHSLSVSALQTLMSCELKFYLMKLRGLCEEDAPDEQMTAAQLGTVMHAIMETVYTSPSGRYPYVVTDAYLSRWVTPMDDGERPLVGVVRRMINRHYYKLPLSDLERELPGAVAAHARAFECMAAQVINYDRSLTPFLYNSSEEESCVPWDLGDGLVVNMKFFIDRRDVVDGKPRIVDYKTGTYHLAINDIHDLFSPEQPAKELFQLLTYACLQAVKDPSVPAQEYALQIYPLGKVIGAPTDPGAWIKSTKSVPTLGGKPLVLSAELIDQFKEYFRLLLRDLLDPSRPFRATPESAKCMYCPFRDAVCGV